MWESNPPKEAYETPQFARTVTRNIKFNTKTSSEVPYGLNVVSGNIALLPIAVELCEHLRLVKDHLVSGCEYTRNASFQIPPLFRAHSDRYYYSIYQTKLNDITGL